MNIAPRTAVFLAIVTVSCSAALAISNVQGKLKNLGWLVVPLFALAGFFLLLAIVTSFRPTPEQLKAKQEESVNLAFKKKPFGRYLTELMLETKLSEKQLRNILEKMLATGAVSLTYDVAGLELWSRMF